MVARCMSSGGGGDDDGVDGEEVAGGREGRGVCAEAVLRYASALILYRMQLATYVEKHLIVRSIRA